MNKTIADLNARLYRKDRKIYWLNKRIEEQQKEIERLNKTFQKSLQKDMALNRAKTTFKAIYDQYQCGAEVDRMCIEGINVISRAIGGEEKNGD